MGAVALKKFKDIPFLNRVKVSDVEVPVTFYDRTYPRLVVDPDPPVELPPELRNFPEELYKTSEWAAVKPQGWTDQKQWKDNAYKQYHATLDKIERMHEDIATYMQNAFQCNLQTRTEWMKSGRKQELMRQKLEEWTKMMPSFEFHRPPALRLDLHNQPIFSIHTTLDMAIRHAFDNLVRALADGCDSLVMLELVGLIDWTSEDACRFHWFEYVIDERVTGTRALTNQSSNVQDDGAAIRIHHQQTTTTHADLEADYRMRRHVHEVVGAKVQPFNSLPQVKHPQRVTVLAQQTPKWLEPIIRIVTGNEIYRKVIEQDLGKKQSTDQDAKTKTWEEVHYRPDPAVVIGYYVLTGWGDDEQ